MDSCVQRNPFSIASIVTSSDPSVKGVHHPNHPSSTSTAFSPISTNTSSLCPSSVDNTYGGVCAYGSTFPDSNIITFNEPNDCCNDWYNSTSNGNSLSQLAVKYRPGIYLCFHLQLSSTKIFFKCLLEITIQYFKH